MPRTWRKESHRDAWRLVSGRGAERERLNLGKVTEAEAEEHLIGMRLAEEHGHADRVLTRHRDRPEDALKFLRGDHQVTKLLGPPKVDYRRMRLKEYFEDHYEEPREKQRPLTWKTEHGHWKRLLEGLGEERVGDLVDDRRIFHRWVRDLMVQKSGGVRRGPGPRPEAKRDRPASGAYKRLLRSALQALLSFAYAEGHVDDMMMLGAGGGLRIKDSTKRALPKVVPLSEVEFKALLKAAATPMRKAMWATGVGQGLRPSELCRMSWEDVDWHERLLKVRGTKTDNAAAIIPLTPLGHQAMRAFWLSKGQPKKGPCWTIGGADKNRETPTKVRQITTYKKALAADAVSAQIGRPLTQYMLRHSFAYFAWLQGIDIDTARRILRHTDEEMLREVYTNPRPQDLHKRLQAFNIAIEEVA